MRQQPWISDCFGMKEIINVFIYYFLGIIIIVDHLVERVLVAFKALTVSQPPKLTSLRKLQYTSARNIVAH